MTAGRFDAVAAVSAREITRDRSRHARLSISWDGARVTLAAHARTRPSTRHRWRCAPPVPQHPPDVLSELADILAERVRAATLGEER